MTLTYTDQKSPIKNILSLHICVIRVVRVKFAMRNLIWRGRTALSPQKQKERP